MIQPDFRSPQERREDVADRTISLMLNLFERVKDHAAGGALSDKVLGLIGFDGPAREVARRASLGLGMKVVIYDVTTVADELLEACGCEQADTLDELLGVSDFISLHCRPEERGKTIINAAQLNKMKPDAGLVSATGWDQVEWQALVHALWFETIGGAAIDTRSMPARMIPMFEECPNVCIGWSPQLPENPMPVASPGILAEQNPANVVVPLRPEQVGT